MQRSGLGVGSRDWLERLYGLEPFIFLSLRLCRRSLTEGHNSCATDS